MPTAHEDRCLTDRDFCQIFHDLHIDGCPLRTSFDQLKWIHAVHIPFSMNRIFLKQGEVSITLTSIGSADRSSCSKSMV